jgi:thiosulfate/3-mercaptopyruvate sulfurtransferase
LFKKNLLEEEISKYIDTNEEIQKYEKTNYKAKYNNELIKKYEDIVKNIETKEYILIDARSKGRFDGTESEPV